MYMYTHLPVLLSYLYILHKYWLHYEENDWLCAPVPQNIRDEVRDKGGMEAANALICALEGTVSVTPQSLMKIIMVLEGLTVTEPAASKMKKALSKSFFSTRRTSISSSSNPGKSVRMITNIVSWGWSTLRPLNNRSLTFNHHIALCVIDLNNIKVVIGFKLYWQRSWRIVKWWCIALLECNAVITCLQSRHNVLIQWLKLKQ